MIELQHGKVVLTESGVAYGGLVRKELELGEADKMKLPVIELARKMK